MRGLATRRHHTARIKAAVRRYWVAGWHPNGRYPEDITPARVGKVASAKQACSCSMCGHTRRHEGPTLQELRQEIGDD